MREYTHTKEYLVFSYYYEDKVEIKTVSKSRMQMVYTLVTTYKCMLADEKGDEAN